MNDPIVVSGVLRLSGSKEAGDVWKYDYIKIGGQRIDNINVHSYINDDVYSAHEHDVSSSIFPGINKKASGTVLAIKKGNSVEKVPYMSSSEAYSETFRVLIASLFVLMIVGGLIGFVIMLCIYAVMLELFGFNTNDSFGVGCITSIILVVGFIFHCFFTHKMSLINRRKFYNKAAQVFD